MASANSTASLAAPELRVDENGHYQPYDFWLSLCGLYDLYRYAFKLFGEVENKRLLDCGCGRGHTSIMFAKRGAQVTAFDTSQTDLTIAKQLAEANQVSVEFNCHPIEGLPFPDEHFDLVFGSCILHHADISEAAAEIHRVLKKDGIAAFIENSARNRLLMLARRFLCGSFGISKYGDDDEEHPLNREDLATLRRHFHGTVREHHPDFLFWRLADMYIFEKRYQTLTRLLKATDGILGKVPLVREFGYFQIIELRKT